MPGVLSGASKWSVLCATATLCLGSLAAAAQQSPGQPPAQTEPTSPPGSETGPKATPTPKAVQPSETPAGATTQDLVGLDVFSSDGTRVGEVRSVNTGPGGNVVALHVQTGGFLGFGGRTIAIPGEKFKRKGESVRLDLEAQQVDELPDVKE